MYGAINISDRRLRF